MAQRLKQAFFSLCVFLGYCGQSFAEVRIAIQPDTRSVSAWYEPRECLQLDPIYTKHCTHELYRIGMMLLQGNHYEQAIVRLSQILQLEEYSMVYANRAVAYVNTGDLKRARADMVRSIGMAPSVPESWYNLARIDLAQKRYRDALDNVTMSLHLRPDAEAYDLRAKIYMVRGQRALARADTKTAWDLRSKEDARHERAEHTSVEEK